MAFMLGNHLTFIDSFQFMSLSLDKLFGNLPDESLKYTKETFKNDRTFPAHETKRCLSL